MQCIVIIVLKIEPAGQVRYNKQQLNSQRRAKHVRNTIELKSYPSLNSDTGCSNGWSSICDLFVAWALDVRDLLFLHSYILDAPPFHTPVSYEYVKKCVLYARKYGTWLFFFGFIYRLLNFMFLVLLFEALQLTGC